MDFTNYSNSLLYRSWLHEYIPIPICGKNYYSLITVEKHSSTTQKRKNGPCNVCDKAFKSLPTLISTRFGSAVALCLTAMVVANV